MTKELQNTKKLTEDTKEEHEKSKTVTDILEEIKQEMCDEYCKYPTLVDDREDLFADETYDKIRKMSKIKIEC